jgi:hypothetical protein
MYRFGYLYPCVGRERKREREKENMFDQ